MQISQKNFPSIVQIGDVKTIGERFDMNPDFANGIDLLIGGSPCQDLSIAKQGREGLKGARSGLFWEYVKILKQVKPKYFVLENVASMKAEAKDEITKALGVEPIMINAALVSAQNRKRLFWTNIPNVTQPEDREIFLKDIILDGKTDDLKSLVITATYHKKTAQDFLRKRSGQMIQIGNIGTNAQAHRVYSIYGKSVALSALGGGQGAKTGLYIVPYSFTEQRTAKGKEIRKKAMKAGKDWCPRGEKEFVPRADGKVNTLTTQAIHERMVLDQWGVLRKLHPIECERLQGLPDNYTDGQSFSQRYKACGNAFNVDVVAHILSFIKKA